MSLANQSRLSGSLAQSNARSGRIQKGWRLRPTRQNPSLLETGEGNSLLRFFCGVADYANLFTFARGS
jgi:hypothetical protein